MSRERTIKSLAEAAKGPHRTGGDVLAKMSQHLFGPDDPDTKFHQWIADSMASGGVRAAAAELGLDVPEGEGFAERLRQAYLAKIGEM